MTGEQEASIAALAADLADVLAQQRERDEAARFADGVCLTSIAEMSQHARVAHAAGVNEVKAFARAFLKAHPRAVLGPLQVKPRAADDLDD
jgi:hypothetical protein